jgi:dihydroxyacid dehydratase/phosphogluconate dehydratase
VDANDGAVADPSDRKRLARWLLQCGQVRAQLATMMTLYRDPHRAGGNGRGYRERAAAGDLTVLQGCLANLIGQLSCISDEVEAVIADTPAVIAFPGSMEKIATLQARLAAGKALFVEGDGPPDGEGPPERYGHQQRLAAKDRRRLRSKGAT